MIKKKKRKKIVQKIDIDNDGEVDVVVTTYEKPSLIIAAPLPPNITITEIKLCKTKNCGKEVYESNGVSLDFCAECARGFKLL